MARRPDPPEAVQRYASWFKAAYGVDPFAPLLCRLCGIDVYLWQVYRCYDCGQAFHRECCRRHCEMSTEHRQTNV